ncbi:hypothetical protein [Salarchaeum japonicum]|uniref:RING-type E3 ubiquitin transferase n=1 Tax=Salarchaeum japonicum TaxID=555573 RepID=A0AAV3T4E6_9EURY|nr:hypothetical protein [Salarchaeum japonicum]
MDFAPAVSFSDVAGGALVLVGLVVLAVSARYVWRASVVVRAPAVAALDDAAEGAVVRLTGTVEEPVNDAVVAPFSGRECVALRVEIEERRLSVLYVLPWYVTVYEATAAVPFTLAAGRASVRVAEPTRTVQADTTIVARAGPGESPSDDISAFERDADGVSASSWWRSPPRVLRPVFRAVSIGTRRYTEQRIAPGDEATVVGRVRDGTLDSLVLSDRGPRATVVRMARTAVGGVCVGLAGLAVGGFLLLG